MNRARAVAACEYCIAGMIPATAPHQVLGLIYQRCPYCLALGVLSACGDCADVAMFPAAFQCLHCLVIDLANRDLAPAVCPGCLGVTHVIWVGDGAPF
jgi:hypothetical protein